MICIEIGFCGGDSARLICAISTDYESSIIINKSRSSHSFELFLCFAKGFLDWGQRSFLDIEEINIETLLNSFVSRIWLFLFSANFTILSPSISFSENMFSWNLLLIIVSLIEKTVTFFIPILVVLCRQIISCASHWGSICHQTIG